MSKKKKELISKYEEAKNELFEEIETIKNSKELKVVIAALIVIIILITLLNMSKKGGKNNVLSDKQEKRVNAIINNILSKKQSHKSAKSRNSLLKIPLKIFKILPRSIKETVFVGIASQVLNKVFKK